MRNAEGRSNKLQETDPKRSKAVAFLTRTELWGGISVLVSLISLTLPWWGIDQMASSSFSWGLLSGPPHPALVTFFSDRLDKWFSENYGFMASLIVLTMFLSALGSLLKRWPLMAAALLSSVVTAVSYIANVGMALNSECEQTYVAPASCISGLVGQGSNPDGSILTWGFKAGFYVFLASGVLILVALVIHYSRARES